MERRRAACAPLGLRSIDFPPFSGLKYFSTRFQTIKTEMIAPTAFQGTRP